MPFPLRQLSLVVELHIRDLARIPAAVLFPAEHCSPEALQVMARFRVDALHFPQEELLQHMLVEFLWVLVDRLTCHGEDGAGLESNRLGRTGVTEIVEEVFEVFCWSLEGPLTLEHTLG